MDPTCRGAAKGETTATWSILQGERRLFGPNWAVSILPYIDQQNLFNANTDEPANISRSRRRRADRNGTGRRERILRGRTTLVDTVIPGFLCPSDANNQNFFVNAKRPRWEPQGWAAQVAITASRPGKRITTIASAGKATKVTKNLSGPSGLIASPMMSSNYGTKIQFVTDGMSNTIMAW